MNINLSKQIFLKTCSNYCLLCQKKISGLNSCPKLFSNSTGHFQFSSRFFTTTSATVKNPIAIPILIRDESYQIINRSSSLTEAQSFYRIKGVPKRCFSRYLESGKCIPHINIFLEYALPIDPTHRYLKHIEQNLKKLKESPVFTGRYRVINAETKQKIGLFRSLKEISQHFNGKISQTTLHAYCKNPSKLNSHKIQVEREFRDFCRNKLFYAASKEN